MEIGKKIKAGDVRAASRLIRNIEDNIPEAKSTIKHIFPMTGNAHVVGITGSPGAGKSTLVDGLIEFTRKRDKTVGVLAVDPTSPFTGGAILGDRIRMQRHAEDPGVFVRSLATRGALGGLAKAVGDAIHVLDVMGKDFVLVETVGTGQQEVEIINHAHTVIVVLVPGMGDEIQAIKAGIMEIADVLVINKADRPGVENTERALRSTLELAHPTRRVFRHHGKTMSVPTTAVNPSLWMPPINKTIATEGKGIAEVVESITKHAAHLRQSGDWTARDRARLGSEMEALLREALMDRFLESVSQVKYEEMIDKVIDRNISPYEAVNFLLNGKQV
jgi:LAO/AO transport system kinase